mmetsp:Transcript_55400/g.161739  ORF Transcript_55400/g.161739 Transcript_55400/m.161739 type:complete len:216 (+) Transcript_55400:1475-2122(+)
MPRISLDWGWYACRKVGVWPAYVGSCRKERTSLRWLGVMAPRSSRWCVCICTRATSRALLTMPLSRKAVPRACFPSTTRAESRAWMDCSMSFSSLLNSASSCSRSAVAWSSDCWLLCRSCSWLLISWPSLALFAAEVSMTVVSSATRASAVWMEEVLSLSFVLHQQSIFWNTSSSASASFSSSFCMSRRRVTTFETGYCFAPGSFHSRARPAWPL